MAPRQLPEDRASCSQNRRTLPLLGHWAGEWPRSQQKYALDQLASGTSGRLQGGRVSSDVHVLPGFRRTGLDLAMLSTIEITPSRVAGFFGYFAVLSLVMLPAAVAFARRKTSRWFLLSAGLLLLIGGILNWWGLLPTFSWNGYEPDWVPICVGAFLVMMLLAIFGNVRRRRRRQR